jgi:hypothetical protein
MDCNTYSVHKNVDYNRYEAIIQICFEFLLQGAFYTYHSMKISFSNQVYKYCAIVNDSRQITHACVDVKLVLGRLLMPLLPH